MVERINERVATSNFLFDKESWEPNIVLQLCWLPNM